MSKLTQNQRKNDAKVCSEILVAVVLNIFSILYILYIILIHIYGLGWFLCIYIRVLPLAYFSKLISYRKIQWLIMNSSSAGNCFSVHCRLYPQKLVSLSQRGSRIKMLFVPLQSFVITLTRRQIIICLRLNPNLQKLVSCSKCHFLAISGLRVHIRINCLKHFTTFKKRSDFEKMTIADNDNNFYLFLYIIPLYS